MPSEAHSNAGVSREVAETVADLLRAVGSEATLHVIDPPERTARAVVGAIALVGADASPTVRVVGEGAMLRRIRRDFLTASEAASFVADGILAFRAAEREADRRLLVADDAVYSLLVADGNATYVTETDESFVASATTAAESVWETAEPFSLRTPGIDRLAVAMTETFGSEFSDQFTEGLDVARGMRDRSEFDPVAASLLVAAHNEELHYEISKLGENTGLGSRATYSRVKTQLEEDGIITTDKEQMEVGRPRQRLRLADSYREVADERGITDLIGHILN